MSETGSPRHQCECEICPAGGDEVTRRYHQQINLLLSRLSEPQRRWYVGVLSAAADSPSDRQLTLITGLDEKTIRHGRQELAGELADIPPTRQRRVGGGQPRTEKDPALEPALLTLVAPHTAGDPMTSTKWLNCRLTDVQEQLAVQGHVVSRPVIGRLLKAHDYRLRANRKELTGPQPPDRNAQFEHIATQRQQHVAAGQPVISVDTKKKELIGNFKNAGRTWGCTPERVNAHDFEQDALGKAVLYGIYDVQHNQGTVYVGQSADTPTFAVDNIRPLVRHGTSARFPQATELLIEADSGGSNAARSRVWKQQRQAKVADRFGLTVTVCHYPTGASKWNPVEHRLFSEISKTWAGCPLRTFDLALDYIQQTRTQTGLRVQTHLVTNHYATGVKVTEDEMDALNLQRHDVCPQWNYTIRPRTDRCLN